MHKYVFVPKVTNMQLLSKFYKVLLVHNVLIISTSIVSEKAQHQLYNPGTL